MYQVLMLAVATMILPVAPLAAQTVHSPRDLDENGDALIELTKPRGPFKAGDVLLQCSDYPRFTYAKTCPVAVLAPPRLTTPPRDFGSSGHVGYSGASDVHVTRALDVFPLRSGGGSIRDVVIERARIAITPEKSRAATLNDVTIERVDAKVTKRGVHVRGDSARWTIRDVRMAYIGPLATPSDAPTGIQIDGTAHDVLIERGEISGFVNTEPTRYPNGDGIACGRGTARITIRDAHVRDNTDGGVDCGAVDLRLDRVTSVSNGRSFRIRGKATAGTISSVNPRSAHIWLGRNASLTVDRLLASGGGVLVDLADPSAVLTIKECDLSGWTGTVLVRGKGKVVLGKWCRR